MLLVVCLCFLHSKRYCSRLMQIYHENLYACISSFSLASRIITPLTRQPYRDILNAAYKHLFEARVSTWYPVCNHMFRGIFLLSILIILRVCPDHFSKSVLYNVVSCYIPNVILSWLNE